MKQASVGRLLASWMICKTSPRRRESWPFFNNFQQSLKISKESLRIFENLWESLKIFENLWESLKIFENLWRISKNFSCALLRLIETAPILSRFLSNFISSFFNLINISLPIRAQFFQIQTDYLEFPIHFVAVDWLILGGSNKRALTH